MCNRDMLNAISAKNKENKNIVEKLSTLFEMFLNESCNFLRKNLPEPVKTVDNNLTQSLMRILDCYFVNYIETEIKRITKDEIQNLESMIPQLFLFSLFWSIGTTTTLEGRLKF